MLFPYGRPDFGSRTHQWFSSWLRQDGDCLQRVTGAWIKRIEARLGGHAKNCRQVRSNQASLGDYMQIATASPPDDSSMQQQHPRVTYQDRVYHVSSIP